MRCSDETARSTQQFVSSVLSVFGEYIRRMSDAKQSGPGELPIIDGSIYGAAAFVAGYLTTLVLVIVFEGRRFVGDLVEGAGWIYYNAQFVHIEPRSAPGGSAVDETMSINYLTGDGLDGIETATIVLPPVIYHAIPIVAFTVAGFFLARKLGANSVVTGVKLGASLAFGAVLLALGGTFVFEVGNALGPDRLRGVVLAGIIYPGVCGAVGGITSVLLDRSAE